MGYYPKGKVPKSSNNDNSATNFMACSFQICHNWHNLYSTIIRICILHWTQNLLTDYYSFTLIKPHWIYCGSGLPQWCTHCQALHIFWYDWTSTGDRSFYKIIWNKRKARYWVFILHSKFYLKFATDCGRWLCRWGLILCRWVHQLWWEQRRWRVGRQECQNKSHLIIKI